MEKRIFLRKILIRLDYQFITESKQEEIYAFIAEKYGDYFSDRGYDQENSIDIEINANLPDASRINSKPQTVYYFTNPKSESNDGRTIKIGKTFLFLDIDLPVESEHIAYYRWIADIICYLNDIKIFKPTRIGMRKFNTFYILESQIEGMNRIFRIPFYDQLQVPSFKIDNFKNVQVYESDGYLINFSRQFSTGLLNNEEFQNIVAHQVAFDFDLYSDNSEFLEKFCKDATGSLKEMSNTILQFFRNVITDEVYENIQSEEFLRDLGIIVY